MFHWANNQTQGNKKNWAFKVKKFSILNKSPHLVNIEPFQLVEMVIPNLDSILWEVERVIWLTSMNREEAQHGVGKHKLGSFNTFKTTFEAEAYVRANLPRWQSRVPAQLRAGVAPLALETGRYQGMAVQERLCFHCKSNL